MPPARRTTGCTKPERDGVALVTEARELAGGVAGVASMQQLAARLWSPSSWWHPGGIGWQAGSIADRESSRVLLVGPPDALVAWAWVELPGHLSALVDPACGDVAGEVVEWFLGVAEAREGLSAQVAGEDVALREALGAEGFGEIDGAPYFLDMRQAARRCEVALPTGYVIRAVQAGDFAARVRLHRSAWEPAQLPFHRDHRPVVEAGATSPFSDDAYRQVCATWPYRPELDLVAVAPDGALAASCIAWLDDGIGAAELEPVGTAPAHRGRGLARALCLAAVSRVSELGGTEVAVHARGDEAYPVPRRVYEGCGFRVRGRTVTFGR